MKRILVVVLGVFCLPQVTLGKITEDQLYILDRECVEELNLPMDVVLNNVNDDWTATENIPEINSLNLCSLRKLDLLHADDTLDAQKFKTFVVKVYLKKFNLKFDNPEESVQNAIENCKNLEGNDKSDTLFKYYNCVLHFVKYHD